MIGLGLAEGRHNNTSLFTESDKDLLRVSEPGHGSRPGPQMVETSFLVSSCLSPFHSKPHSHETPHNVGTGLSAVLCDFSWKPRNKLTPEKALDKAHVRERVLSEFNLASQ